jgi:hypothetical protein
MEKKTEDVFFFQDGAREALWGKGTLAAEVEAAAYR